MTASEWEREMGVGAGKVHEAGFNLRTPEAKLRHMSVRCPQGYWHRQAA